MTKKSTLWSKTERPAFIAGSAMFIPTQKEQWSMPNNGTDLCSR